MAIVFKSYEIVLIRVFFHAELISALKMSQNLWFLRNMQKMEKEIFIIIIFYLLRFLYKSFK